MRSVDAAYPGGDSRLRNVDLTLGSGELVCVLGPNGAGKTTLVRVLSGLLAPVKGDVKLLGKALGDLPRNEIAKTLAVVEQVQEGTALGFTVREVVSMGRAPHQGAWMRPSDADEAIVADAIRRCDLESLADRPAHQLSGGEQKRVAFARALAQEPKVLLLDEPGAFLDIRHQLDLYELLSNLVSEKDIACLVVMHDLNLAAQFADRIVLVKSGEIVATGTVPEVMTYRILRETFDADLYCGVNELDQTRYFIPIRGPLSRDDRDPRRS